MTTMTRATTTAPVARHQTLRVTQPRVLLSEWTKFRSLRSTIWTLLTAVVLSIGIGATHRLNYGLRGQRISTTSPDSRRHPTRGEQRTKWHHVVCADAAARMPAQDLDKP